MFYSCYILEQHKHDGFLLTFIYQKLCMWVCMHVYVQRHERIKDVLETRRFKFFLFITVLGIEPTDMHAKQGFPAPTILFSVVFKAGNH
jgi:hypothetical protein